MNDVHPIGIKRDTDKYHGINTSDSEENVPCSSQSEYTRVTKVTNIPTATATPVIIPLLPPTSAMIPPLARFQFLPRFHSLHSSPSIRITSPLLPPCLCCIYPSRITRSSLHQLAHPRSRLFQPTGALVIPRVPARSTETRRFGRVRRMRTSSWWSSPSPPSRSSLSDPPRHVSIARSLSTTDYRESVEGASVA